MTSFREKHENILVLVYPSQFLLVLDLVIVNFYAVFSYKINLLLAIVLVLAN